MVLPRFGIVANPHKVIEHLLTLGYDTRDRDSQTRALTQILVDYGIYAYSQDLRGIPHNNHLMIRGVREIVNHVRVEGNLTIALVKDQITGKRTDHDRYTLIHDTKRPDPAVKARRPRQASIPVLSVDDPDEPGIALALPIFQEVWKGVAIFIKV
ncbi:MAG: hypothetical protein OYG31_02170 [Candidatus Kaiserbacteria bacterium]|nr:hypothetical protein [Candidatus Kaiserbacteria bacterium]